MLLTIPFLWSCSAEEPTVPEPDVPAVEDQNFVSLDEALKIADKHFALVYGNETRSSRNVENVEFFNRNTRSESDDAHGFYVVNYKDNGGFDSRILVESRIHYDAENNCPGMTAL